MRRKNFGRSPFIEARVSQYKANTSLELSDMIQKIMAEGSVAPFSTEQHTEQCHNALGNLFDVNVNVTDDGVQPTLVYCLRVHSQTLEQKMNQSQQTSPPVKAILKRDRHDHRLESYLQEHTWFPCDYYLR